MPIDIHDLLRAQRKASQRQQRKEWRKAHLFDIINAVLSIAALIISIIALFT